MSKSYRITLKKLRYAMLRLGIFKRKRFESWPAHTYWQSLKIWWNEYTYSAWWRKEPPPHMLSKDEKRRIKALPWLGRGKQPNHNKFPRF